MYRSSTRRVEAEGLSFNQKNFELLKQELKRLQMNNAEQEIAIKLNKVSDFVTLFYMELPTARTKTEAFNKYNDIYFDYYGDYRFANYQNFLKAMNKYLKSIRSND